MLATCEHCGHRNEVPDSAANSDVACQKCGQSFFAFSPQEIAANRRATKLLLAAVLVFFVLIVLLLLSRSGSSALKSARRALVGTSVAGKLEAAGLGEGEGQNGSGTSSSVNDGLPDPLSTNSARPSGASIGRLPQNISERKGDDEIRAGAAGSDDPS